MLLELARQPEYTVLSLGTVSRNTDISRRYLDQLAIALKSAGLVVAISGRSGGYRLARPAAQINLGEIVEASIGPVNIVECVCNPEICERHQGCRPRAVYTLINHRITQVFRQISLAELADPETLDALLDSEPPSEVPVGCPR